jgi:hypothetical protein
MNKKGTIGDIVMDNVIYLILLIIFFVGMMAFVNSKMNGAVVWEDYYAKELAKVIDLSKPGDVIVLDVQKATEIAQKNKVANFEDIFSFDNINNEVCVRLSLGKASCYYYFNEVSVTYDESGKWMHYAEPVNRLHFKVMKGEGQNA